MLNELNVWKKGQCIPHDFDQKNLDGIFLVGGVAQGCATLCR